jgi:hypothetical protein
LNYFNRYGDYGLSFSFSFDLGEKVVILLLGEAFAYDFEVSSDPKSSSLGYAFFKA